MDNDLLCQLINYRMRYADDIPYRDGVMVLYHRIIRLRNIHNTYCTIEGRTMTIYGFNDMLISIYEELTNNEQKALVYIEGSENLVRIYETSEPSFFPTAQDYLNIMKRLYERAIKYRNLLYTTIPKIKTYLKHDIAQITNKSLELLDRLVKTTNDHNYTDLRQIELELGQIEKLISNVRILISETESNDAYMSHSCAKDFIMVLETYYNHISSKKLI